MILYFSATGNSKYCAEFIAGKTNEKIISLNDMIKHENFSLDCENSDRLGIIAPVYGLFPALGAVWDLAWAVGDFLERLELKNLPEDVYIYGIFTCGDNSGYSDETLRKILKRKNLNLSASFALSMPDNYSPMFKIESPERQAEHLKKADITLNEIANDIVEKNHVSKMTRRPPKIFVWLVKKLFMPGQKKVKDFTVNDKCIGCARCVKVCPMNIIAMKENKPVWTKDNCACCLACLNRCPANAINRGKSAKNGRYINPRVKF